MTVLPFPPPARPPPKGPSRPKRGRRMHLALSEEEENILDGLARKRGLSRSDCLRLCLWNVHHRGGL